MHLEQRRRSPAIDALGLLEHIEELPERAQMPLNVMLADLEP
jgi:hypothetical protein